ncbi:glycosyltransferase [uncultured Methanobrevibacter sp.]|uniref:glycosyltransferase family 2 protein n=1 Tax=uncultured Methanobrevibacter sp. TaxID=253161 RepID=UPI0026247192|nr:glycosyltransferase [uncultured Methanobrevibacter sp.]
MNPKVSVIMPSLNVADYIEECIKSVVMQTLGDIEIICIDAGSDDGTLEILEMYADKDERIRLLHSDVKSYGHQMNAAIAEAKGDYIAIVETDDYIASNMFESLFDLSENGSVDVIKGNFYHVSERETRKDTGKKGLVKENVKFTIEDYPAIIKAHPSIWAGIYRREFLLDNNITFIEEPGGAWVDNPFFYETSFAAKSIKYTDEAYYYYREFNPTSSTNNLSDYTIPIKRMLDNLDVVDKYNKKSDAILSMVYMRAFAYLRNIERREYFTENLPEVRPLLFEMMKRLDEAHIKSKRDKTEYYKYLSPLRLKRQFSDEEYEYLLRENDFLYESLSQCENRKEDKQKEQSSFKGKLKKFF